MEYPIVLNMSRIAVWALVGFVSMFWIKAGKDILLARPWVDVALSVAGAVVWSFLMAAIVLSSPSQRIGLPIKLHMVQVAPWMFFTFGLVLWAAVVICITKTRLSVETAISIARAVLWSVVMATTKLAIQ